MKKTILTFFSAILLLNTFGQTLDQSNTGGVSSGWAINSGAYTSDGQSFTAGLSGFLSSITISLDTTNSVYPIEAGNFTLTVRSGDGYSGAVLGIDTFSITGLEHNGDYNIPVKPNTISITSANIYTFIINDISSGSGQIMLNASDDDYAGGTLYYQVFSGTPNTYSGDLLFKTYVKTPCTPTNSTLTETGCDSLVSPSEKYTWKTNGTYNDTIQNVEGCDSVMTINLTIIQPTSSTLTQTACSSYTLNSQTYNTSGTYTQTLTNSVGCDSTLTLNLTINQPTTSTLTQTACSSYTLNSQTYNTNGTYTQTLTNSAGCDSTLTLNLTINTVDTTVTQTSDTLMANASGATYQWISCGSPDLLIAGATNQSFTPATNGYYAVVVTQGSCSDTSACHDVTTTGINNYSLNSDNITVYPMPNDGNFAITFIGIGYQSITIYDETGKKVSAQILDEKNPNISLNVNLSAYPSGIYFAQILTSHGLENKKILIQK